MSLSSKPNALSRREREALTGYYFVVIFCTDPALK